MKYRLAVALILISVVGLLNSCKRTTYDKYIYNKHRDTIPPIISISVPLNNDIYNAAEDVHIIGTVQDFEVTGKAGSLSSFVINVYQIDPSNDTIIATVYQNSFPVTGTDIFRFSPRFSILSLSSPRYYRMEARAEDESTRFDRKMVYFTIVP